MKSNMLPHQRLERLPNKILLKILSLLRLDDLIWLRNTSSTFKKLVDLSYIKFVVRPWFDVVSPRELQIVLKSATNRYIITGIDLSSKLMKGEIIPLLPHKINFLNISDSKWTEGTQFQFKLLPSVKTLRAERVRILNDTMLKSFPSSIENLDVRGCLLSNRFFPKGVRHLEVDFSSQLFDEGIRCLPFLNKLVLYNCNYLLDEALGKITNIPLTLLALHDARRLTSDALKYLGLRLQILHLSNCSHLANFALLSRLKLLKELHLTCVPVALQTLPQDLPVLSLEAINDKVDLRLLPSHCKKLYLKRCIWLKSLEGLYANSSLEHLHVIECPVDADRFEYLRRSIRVTYVPRKKIVVHWGSSVNLVSLERDHTDYRTLEH
eukprot:TRINITY_DN25204_c0_g1_i1.p1 TRINITY_DN25204_c0_g1~~TRINITY_DN25204_c0_g1_i1.p1  ORF type:complete len:380 (+),score=61.57 TRINITY_DN25204_c0_g1_i1:42-1181(+)